MNVRSCTAQKWVEVRIIDKLPVFGEPAESHLADQSSLDPGNWTAILAW